MERSSATTLLQRLSPLFFLFLLTVGTWPALEGLAIRWLKFDEAYSHGFLVLAVSLYLSVRQALRTCPKVGFYGLWVVPFVLSALVYLAGSVLLIEAFQQVALLPLLFSGLLVHWGWRQTAPFIIPIGLMLFALPIWDYVSWPLQLVTVAVNQFLLSHLNIEFVVEGVFVYFPGIGAFEIANGCSGLRYLLVGMTLCALYGELSFRRLQSRATLLVAGVVLALAANWIRVFVIIYLGYESNMTSPLVNAHDTFGWWVFAGTLVPLFFFANWLEKREIRNADVGTLDEPGRKMTAPSASGARYGLTVMLMLVAGMAGLSWVSVLKQSSLSFSGSEQHTVRLMESDLWLPLFERNLSGWQPGIERPDRVLVETYVERDHLAGSDSGPDEKLLVALYSYDFQRPGGEVVQYGNRLYNPEFLLPERTFTIKSGPDESTLTGVTLRYRRGDVRIHLAYGYYVEGRWEGNELQAKLAQLPGIFNIRTDASLLVVGIQCTECDGEQALASLAPDIKKTTQAYLDRLYTATE